MKLLLVEDEKNFAYCLKDELKKDYLIDLAFSGEEAEYKTAEYTYDGVILDIGLPDIDGIRLCKKFRNNNIYMPIIMLTGEENISKKVEALDSGADD